MRCLCPGKIQTQNMAVMFALSRVFTGSRNWEHISQENLQKLQTALLSRLWQLWLSAYCWAYDNEYRVGYNAIHWRIYPADSIIWSLFLCCHTKVQRWWTTLQTVRPVAKWTASMPSLRCATTTFGTHHCDVWLVIIGTYNIACCQAKYQTLSATVHMSI